MNIMDIHINALKYPMQDIKKLLILGVIILFSFLIFPFFLALGYIIRVMKNTTENNDTLPEFDNIGSMFIDGVKLLIVYFIYRLIPLIIIGIPSIIIGIGLIPVFGLIGIGLATLNPSAIIATFGVYLIFIIIGVIIVIVVNMIVLMTMCMAVVNMAHTGKFGAAFRVSEIIQRIKNIGIGTYILWFITLIITYMIVSILLGISMIISILLGIIMIIPLLGIILVLLIGPPYLFLFVSKSMASIYMKGS